MFSKNPTRSFITDMGASEEVTNLITGEKLHLPRYGVWEWSSTAGKHQVTECSDNLPHLMGKFNLTKDDVHIIKKGNGNA